MINDRYVPTPEELEGNSWQACYGQPVVIPPPEETHADTE